MSDTADQKNPNPSGKDHDGATVPGPTGEEPKAAVQGSSDEDKRAGEAASEAARNACAEGATVQSPADR